MQWRAGWIIDGRRGLTLPVNIRIGVVGGVVGGFLFRLLAIAAGGLIGSIVTSAAGAVALLYFISRCKKT